MDPSEPTDLPDSDPSVRFLGQGDSVIEVRLCGRPTDMQLLAAALRVERIYRNQTCDRFLIDARSLTGHVSAFGVRRPFDLAGTFFDKDAARVAVTTPTSDSGRACVAAWVAAARQHGITVREFADTTKARAWLLSA